MRTTGAADEEVVDVVVGRADRDSEFAAFMRAHQADLLHTAWLLCGDAHRAEELTQAALVRAYAAWPRVRTNPLAYTRRTLANLRVDTWRRRRREVLTAPDELPDAPGGRPSPDASAGLGERDQLVRALALLSARQRRIVVLRYFAGLSESEVARDLGVSLGTVKSTSSRGLATLREALGPATGSAS